MTDKARGLPPSRHSFGRMLGPMLLATGLAACAGGSAGAGGPGSLSPAQGAWLGPDAASALPPIPAVTGPLRLRVQYPDSLQLIAAADSNFLFGTTGTGDATLLIDGSFVEVEPNGTFLAWLPLPQRAAGDTAWYHLVARRGSDVDTISHPVLLRPELYEGDGASLWIDTTSLVQPDVRWALPDESVELSARVAPGSEAWLLAGSARVDMTQGYSPGQRLARIPAALLHAAACSPRTACEWTEEADSLSLRLIVRMEGQRLEQALNLHLRILDPQALPVVQLRENPSPVHGANGMVAGRPVPDGPYRWRFPEGARATVDGRIGSRLRLRLAPGLAAWVDVQDVAELPPGTPAPASEVGDLRFVDRGGRLVLDIPLASALPVAVDEPDPRTLRLRLYGALGHTNRIELGRGSRRVRGADWRQEAGGEYVLTLRMRQPVWGYRVSYLSGSEGATLRLEVNRAPWIDPARPLAGRRIAIDPGHPGGGAHGPSGTYEGDVNLAIARVLGRLLRQAGAEPILTRDDTLPLGLYERTRRAEEAGAELFVSIHNNALPDGVRPFGREGTSTYYFHPHSRDLAWRVHEGLLSSMGLRDLGVVWGDLAVARMSWMPSVLAEGAFMMNPAHEAALGQASFQEAYARGVLEGIRAFLEDRAAEAPRR